MLLSLVGQLFSKSFFEISSIMESSLLCLEIVLVALSGCRRGLDCGDDGVIMLDALLCNFAQDNKLRFGFF